MAAAPPARPPPASPPTRRRLRLRAAAADAGAGRGGADEAEQRLRRPGGQEEEGRKGGIAPPPPTTRRARGAARAAATLKANMQPYVIRRRSASATGAKVRLPRGSGVKQLVELLAAKLGVDAHAIEAAVLLPNVDITDDATVGRAAGGLRNRGPPGDEARGLPRRRRADGGKAARVNLSQILRRAAVPGDGGDGRAQSRAHIAARSPNCRPCARTPLVGRRRALSRRSDGRCCAVGRGWRWRGGHQPGRRSRSSNSTS